jgi:hypothetical protein
MIVELVTFPSPLGKPRDQLLEEAKATLPRWRANDGNGHGAGLYIWPSREAAERAHDAEWQSMVEQRTGSKPTFRYFDLLILLDNENGTVTEWPEPDRAAVVAAE